MFDQWLKIEFDSGARPEATIVCAISRRRRSYFFFSVFEKKKSDVRHGPEVDPLGAKNSAFWRCTEVHVNLPRRPLRYPSPSVVPAPVRTFSVGSGTTVWTGHGYVVLRTSGGLLSRGFNVFDEDSSLGSLFVVNRQGWSNFTPWKVRQISVC